MNTRNTKKKTIDILLILFLLIILSLCLSRFIPLPRPCLREPTAGTTLPFDPALHLRQGKNLCGPYSAMAFQYLLTEKRISPEVINDEMVWRFKNSMTFPFGISRYLRHNGIRVRHCLLILLNDRQRICFLKKILNGGSPVIILNRTGGYLHYFTVLGFGENTFYLYDSLQGADSINPEYTIDTNGPDPGNRSCSADELLRLWRNARIKSLSPWYCLVSGDSPSSD